MRSEPCILVLWNHLPGYLLACLRVLLRDYRIPVFLVIRRNDQQCGLEELSQFAQFRSLDLGASTAVSTREILESIRQYEPSIVLVGSPKYPLFVRLARAARQRGALVASATDHYWKGTWRDYVNVLTARLGITYTSYDAAMVPGRRGREYMRRIGFVDQNIFEGVLACDTDVFRVIGIERLASTSSSDWPKVFLYVGRYVACKDLPTLVAAYRLYRSLTNDPWDLWCVGSGSLSSVLQGQAGVRDLGHLAPRACGDVMRHAGALALASLYDHWGVAIHEATCAGLPVLVSDACGASTDLVRDGYNGFTFPRGDAKTLAHLMCYIAESGQARKMGGNSLHLSYQFDPKLWAEALLVHIPYRLRGRSLLETPTASVARL